MSFSFGARPPTGAAVGQTFQGVLVLPELQDTEHLSPPHEHQLTSDTCCPSLQLSHRDTPQSGPYHLDTLS